MVKSIGKFKIARVGVRANSREDLTKGMFHIIEINIFLPMPLVLLDKNKSLIEKHSFIKQSMRAAAHLAAQMEYKGKRYAIFFRSLAAHYKTKGMLT